MIDIPSKTAQNGFSLPVYGLGTWQMGGRSEPDQSHDQLDIEAIKTAINLGVTHIDTAESYADGHTEEIIGRAINHQYRKKLLLASKVSAWNQTFDGVISSFEASVKRMGVDYLDLYMLHRYPGNGIDISETMRAMDHLVDTGKVKQIGVCNMTVAMLEEVQKHTTNHLVCNQLHYSLECREIVDKGILQYCQENGILVTAWAPLSKGHLQKAPILEKIAKKYNKSAYQVAINWLVSQDSVVVIPKTSNREHLKENLGALGWSLDKEDINELTLNFPNQMLVSDRVPLNYETGLK